jgi:hypothetical protein
MDKPTANAEAIAISGINLATVIPIKAEIRCPPTNAQGCESGPNGTATAIDDGYYINLTPTSGNVEFYLPSAILYPGRMYILRNIADTETAIIYSAGGTFFAGDNRVSESNISLNPGDGNTGNSFPSKTIMLISDGVNWTYGHFH